MKMKGSKISKFLSLVLRHKPEEVGITLDESGWVPVKTLVKAIHTRFPEFTEEVLDDVVMTNDKKRFEFDVTGTKIRACQGHSVEVDLQLESKEPPEELYHGTLDSKINSIMMHGLLKGGRHAVHLSADRETAKTVGERRGRPLVLTIRARDMHKDGFVFEQSTNGVWLTEHVPWKYISI